MRPYPSLLRNSQEYPFWVLGTLQWGCTHLPGLHLHPGVHPSLGPAPNFGGFTCLSGCAHFLGCAYPGGLHPPPGVHPSPRHALCHLQGLHPSLRVNPSHRVHPSWGLPSRVHPFSGMPPSLGSALTSWGAPISQAHTPSRSEHPSPAPEGASAAVQGSVGVPQLLLSSPRGCPGVPWVPAGSRCLPHRCGTPRRGTGSAAVTRAIFSGGAHDSPPGDGIYNACR